MIHTHKDRRFIPQHQRLELTPNYKPAPHFVIVLLKNSRALEGQCHTCVVENKDYHGVIYQLFKVTSC